MTSYKNGDDFVKALNSADGLSPSPVSMIGFAKPSASASGSVAGGPAFQFSPGFDCSVWISIPTSVVSTVNHLDTSPCGDHSHDVGVRAIELKTPVNPGCQGLLRPRQTSGYEPVVGHARASDQRGLWRPSGSAFRVECGASDSIPIHGLVPLAAARTSHRFPHPTWPPHWPTHGCDLGCSLAFSVYYPQAVAALRTLKGIGGDHEQDPVPGHCERGGEPNRLLRKGTSVPADASAIASAIAGRCGIYGACEQVF